MSKPLILLATSEIYPFSKTGGLADVLGALPLALQRMGLNVAVITPFYGRLSTGDIPLRLVCEECPVGYPWAPITAEIYQADYHGVTVYFVNRAEYFDRRYYYNTHKGDYFDNCERFTFFCRAAVEWMRRFDWAPAVVHAHDWQTSLIPAYVYFLRRTDPFWKRTVTVTTIHNLAFQGRFSSRLFWDSGLPREAWHMDGVEHYGDFNLLKAGIAYSDSITTVSPTYAQEILTPEFGSGLEGILARRADVLSGFLNGADYDVWDPETDKFLACNYSPENLDGKSICKKSLLQEFCLDESLLERPILGFIGRLRRQKGIDLLLDILPELLELNLGVIVLGEGNLEFEQRLMGLVEDYPRLLGVRIGYTEDLAHRIQAGSDIFLMPSRYEPCGLTQMYSLRYGTPPVATAVGGLHDTVIPYPHPESIGFTFPESTPEAFKAAILQALDVWSRPEEWGALRKRAMLADYSWESAAASYLQLYRGLGAYV